MKLQNLLACVAALALTAAPALAGNPIYQGSASGPYDANGNAQSTIGTYTGTAQLTLAQNYVNGPNNQGDVSLLLITGGAANDNGTATNSDGATFTLKGAVSTDCAYYTGNASTTIDFGTIGIYASDDTGPANAFDMTAPADVTIDTNLAGCNTSNTVTVSKNNVLGLVNTATVGYDSNVFQANLEYQVTGTYTAGAVGSTAPANNGAYINLAPNAASTFAQHGAWKSPMSLKVNIPVPSKSLLAGTYEGQLTVEIKAL